MTSKIGNYLQQVYGSKPITIVGLGREGNSTYQFLRQVLPEVEIQAVDDQPLEKLAQIWTQWQQTDSQLEILTSDEWLAEPIESVIFLTPGLPLRHPIRRALREPKYLITSNTQLCLELIKHFLPQVITIGVTGTKGKSTTTTMIHHLLQTAGLLSWVGGNLGQPALEILTDILNSSDQDTVKYLVLELSAHQLDLFHLSPQIAVIQHVAPEHLDYYGNFERYLAAKSHLTEYQSSDDVVIFNPASRTAKQIASESLGQKLTFFSALTGQEPSLPAHTLAIVKDQQIMMRYEGTQFETVVTRDQVPLKGAHNLENILPAVVLAAWLKIDVRIVAEAIISFTGLANRLEKVTDIDGVSYYNDSLATVQEATIAALKSFGKKSIVLLAGGYDRSQPLRELAETILTKNVKCVILFPTTGQRLWEEMQTVSQQRHQPLKVITKEVASMAEAVKAAAAQAAPGDIVLLSPAAASFNLFKDYQDRGDQFKAAVMQLAID